jgi:predicted NBD/HSP70 family sugar kinase
VRKINPNDFRVARRSTSRNINRQIALNLIWEHQPISRAQLARRMRSTRGSVGILVDQLITEGLIYEGAAGEAPLGRKPVSLHVRTRDRLVVAVDARLSQIYVMLCDFGGRQVAFKALDPILSPTEFVRELIRQVRGMLESLDAPGQCEGIGVVIPGVVDRETGRVLYAPLLGWRDVEIRDPLACGTGLPVVVESAAKACALAQMWLSRDENPNPNDFIYISVSDGVGTGLVIGGELVRGQSQTAGEFGHMPLSLDGPRCACGANGCWMAYVSNFATIERYNQSRKADESLTVTEIISRARSGDIRALAAIQATARYLGLGLVTIIHGVDPARIYIGGEITAGWDIVEPTMHAAVSERALTSKAAETLILPSRLEHPRLRGAAALIAAPIFAAPQVA